jgi:hypothetical protein
MAFKVTDMATTTEPRDEKLHCQAWDLGSKAQAPLPRSGVTRPTLLCPLFFSQFKVKKNLNMQTGEM